MPVASDPFDTLGLRARVLDAWGASPARFREDANAEEDFALGGHRDRLVVELAQNAADAAVRAGVEGRLHLRLDGAALLASNTGAPLDGDGVAALSTLRASAKRGDDGIVGRFGVGFAAVLALTDEPSIASRTGAVRWSRTATGEVLAGVPALAGELDRRTGNVPVLRLPFPAQGVAEPTYDTSVVLPLRDVEAVATARRLLTEVDAALLLSLPALAEVVIDIDAHHRVLSAVRSADRVTTIDGGSPTTWRTMSSGGRLDPVLLADRPTEERVRATWSVTWAVPVDAADGPRPMPASTPAVVHAPTVTDEVLSLPALLLASFPLDPARRHVAPGPLRDALVGFAAAAYADLVTVLPPTVALLTLVPGPLPRGALDAEIGRAIRLQLSARAWLPAVDGSLVRPRDAVVVQGADDDLVAALAGVQPGLLAASWARQRSTLEGLGVRRVSVADVVDSLAEVHRAPAQWRALYEAMAAVPRDELGSLPVPLADGRTVRGPRGLLLPDGEMPAGLEVLGLRVVHPDAVCALLERLGAQRATPRALLADPAVRAAVVASADLGDRFFVDNAGDTAGDDGDVTPDVAGAVLGLVAAAGLAAGEEPWLSLLVLTDDEGEPAAARDLVLPGGLAAEVFDAEAVGRVDPHLVERWGLEVLAAVGVLDTLVLLRDADVVLDQQSCDHDLADEAEWLEDVLGYVTGDDRATPLPPMVSDFVAIADLDLVRDDAWPLVLRHIAGDRDLRAAVLDPLRLVGAAGRGRAVPSYSAWYLRHAVLIGGRPPSELRDPRGDPALSGLWPDADLGDYDRDDRDHHDDRDNRDFDRGLLHALGMRTTVAALLAEPGGADDLLDRLADESVEVSRAGLAALLVALAGVDPATVSPPTHVRVPVGLWSRVVAADDVLVVDRPDLLPFAEHPLPAAGAYAKALADVLDLPLASAVLDSVVSSSGRVEPIPEFVHALLPNAPRTWVSHDVVMAGGRELDWLVVDGTVHAATLDGLARGVAWACDAWAARADVAAVLADGATPIDLLLAEADFDPTVAVSRNQLQPHPPA